MEKQSNSSGESRSLLHFSRDPERLGEEEHPTRELPTSFQCSMTFCGNQMKVKYYAQKCLPEHWILLGPGSEKIVMETLTIDSGTAQPTTWYGNSKKLVISYFRKYQCIQSRGLAAEKRLQYDSLLRRYCEYGILVSNSSFREPEQHWCSHFGLTSEDKEQVAILVDDGILTVVPPTFPFLLVVLNLGGASLRILEIYG